jgi:photosystem II stability/assembly factor-like uncharacterized protein
MIPKFFQRLGFRRSPQAMSLLLTLGLLFGFASAWKLERSFRAAAAKVYYQPALEFEQDASKKLDWFYFQRTFPSGQLPANARLAAWNRRPASAQGPAASGWLPLGPAPTNSDIPNWGMTSGRINAIAISPNNPNLVLVGASTGGVWRSTDGGGSFTPVSDNQVDLAVGSIAFAPSDPSIVYAGMGDQAGGYVGTGVLKSLDGGQTWARVSGATLPAPGRITKIAVNPADPNLVYVTQYLAQAGPVTEAGGVFRSTDGGVTWTKTLPGLGRDLALRPNNPNTIYAAMARNDQPGQPAGVYRSLDGGVNWNVIYTAPFDQPSNFKLAVTPANDNFLYVYLGGTNAQALFELRVEVSTNGGGTFTNRGNPGIDTGQFTYNNFLAVSPADPNTVYIGSRDVYKSTNGAVSFVNVNGNFDLQGNYTPLMSNAHPDQHCLAIVSGNANTLFLGNDGGLYKSTDAGATFTGSNNGLSLTQFVGYALHPADGNRSYGGAQDNGSQKRINTNTPGAWRELSSGDGGRTVINPLNPSIVFSTYIYGSITRWLNDAETRDNEVGTNEIFGEPANGARIAFYPPFTGNKVNSTLYFGTWRLFVSTNLGDTWTAPGGMTDLTTGNFDVLSAIGVARSNPNVIYTGSSEGRAMVSVNGGANWMDITAGLPQRSITSITVSPTNPALAYLTVSGYGSGHIFLTTNTGANWMDLSNNLPDIPVNALLIDPLNASTLYAGTDVGVFRSTNSGTAWNTFNNGLPPVIVTNLDAQASGRIQLATYGRGAYELVNNLPECPAVTGIVQTGGAIGSAVTINGTDLTGITTVRFSGNVNAVNPIITATQIIAVVPVGAQSGPITLIKAGCPDVQTPNFTVNGTCPVITITGALPNGTISTPYAANALTAAGDGANYTFTVSAGTLPAGLQLQATGTATANLTGTPTAPGVFNFTIRATAATSNCVRDQAYTVTIASVGLQFFPLPAPVRLLDTRAGEAACTQPSAPIAGQTSLTQMGRGLCNIPANAVALTGNITTVQSGGGYLTLYPSNAPQPTVASTNYGPNEIINNVFTVGLGPDGAFKIFAFFTTEVVVDVTGYYAPPAANGLYFHPLPKPIRLLETRAGETGCNTPGAPIQGGVAGTRTQQARLTCDGVTIPAGALAIVGNATTVGPQAGGYLTLFPANAAQPLVASSNYNAGQVVNGPFSVGLAPTGEFNIFTFATTHLVVDVLGYYSTEANDVNGAGLLFNPLPKPVRLLETRANQPVGCYLPGLPLISGVENTQPARGLCDGVTIPANALGVVGNATVVTPNAAGFLTLWPSTALRPLVATANYNAGDVGNRHFIVGLGAGDGAFKLFSSATTELVVDLSGYFAP